MYNVILIYEIFPESLKIYSLQVNDFEWNQLKNCHDKFISAYDFDPKLKDWMIKFLEEKEPFIIYNGEDKIPINLIHGDTYLIVSGISI